MARMNRSRAQRGRYAVRAIEILCELDGLSAEGAGSASGPYAGLEVGAFSVETTEYAAAVPHGTRHARLVPTTADEDPGDAVLREAASRA